MAGRMLPLSCPRCQRPSETWTVVHRQGEDSGEGGCACGEVIPLYFEEEALADPSAGRRPARWREERRADGWRATLAPSPRRFALACLSVALAVFGVWLLNFKDGFAGTIYALPGAAALAYFTYAQGRAWTFAIDSGRFRAEAFRERYDFALADILRFSVARSTIQDRRPGRPLQLLVHLSERAPVRIPLYVGYAEAEFIAKRANTLLASEGRDVEERGYRGERLRVAELEAPEEALTQAEGEEEALGTQAGRSATRRRG